MFVGVPGSNGHPRVVVAERVVNTVWSLWWHTRLISWRENSKTLLFFHMSFLSTFSLKQNLRDEKQRIRLYIYLIKDGENLTGSRLDTDWLVRIVSHFFNKAESFSHLIFIAGEENSWSQTGCWWGLCQQPAEHRALDGMYAAAAD